MLVLVPGSSYLPPATLWLRELITNNNNIVLETFLYGVYFSFRANLFNVTIACFFHRADSSISTSFLSIVYRCKRILFALSLPQFEQVANRRRPAEYWYLVSLREKLHSNVCFVTRSLLKDAVRFFFRAFHIG